MGKNKCEFCNEPFAASRDDAQFCSSRCRTANWRREQRRQAAEDGMMTEWDGNTLSAYGELTAGMNGLADKIKDMWSEHSPDAAAQTVWLLHHVKSDLSFEMNQQLQQKDEVIARLRQNEELLQQIRQLVN